METADFADILRALDIAVLTRMDTNQFKVAGRTPAWLSIEASAFIDSFDPAECFPYLEIFLEGAETFWAGNPGPDEKLTSDTWTETDNQGTERHFEARALAVNGKNVLLIKSLGKAYEDKMMILQKARNKLLEFEKLSRTHEDIYSLYKEMVEYLRM